MKLITYLTLLVAAAQAVPTPEPVEAYAADDKRAIGIGVYNWIKRDVSIEELPEADKRAIGIGVYNWIKRDVPFEQLAEADKRAIGIGVYNWIKRAVYDVEVSHEARAVEESK